MAWHGWLNDRGHRWEHVSEAPTPAACIRQLGRVGSDRGTPSRHQVITDGAGPRASAG